LIALGFDPRTAVFHAMVRNGEREWRQSFPLGMEHKILFNAVKGLLENL